MYCYDVSLKFFLIDHLDSAGSIFVSAPTVSYLLCLSLVLHALLFVIVLHCVNTIAYHFMRGYTFRSRVMYLYDDSV